MEPIVVESRITLMDLSNLLKIAMKRKGSRTRYAYLAMIAVFVVFVLGLFLTISFNADIGIAVMIFFPILFIGVFGINLYFIIAFLRLYRQLSPYMKAMHRYSFSEDCVTITPLDKDLGQGESISYSLISQAVEDRKGFYLLFDDEQAYVLPKCDMGFDNIEALSKLLQEKLESKYLNRMGIMADLGL